MFKSSIDDLLEIFWENEKNLTVFFSYLVSCGLLSYDQLIKVHQLAKTNPLAQKCLDTYLSIQYPSPTLHQYIKNILLEKGS